MALRGELHPCRDCRQLSLATCQYVYGGDKVQRDGSVSVDDLFFGVVVENFSVEGQGTRQSGDVGRRHLK